MSVDVEMLNVAPDQRPSPMEGTLARLMRDHGKKKPANQTFRAPLREHAVEVRPGEEARKASVRPRPPGGVIKPPAPAAEPRELAKTPPFKGTLGCQKRLVEKTH